MIIILKRVDCRHTESIPWISWQSKEKEKKEKNKKAAKREKMKKYLYKREK